VHVRTAGSAHVSATPTPTRPPRALANLHYWRYVSRLAPWTVVATGVLLGVAWASRTHLDEPLEMSVLAVVTTLPLCTVFDDGASAFTAAAPTPLWARRLSFMSGPFVVVTSAWAVTVAVAGADSSAPWWAVALEWATVAASQLALGAAAARRQPTNASVLPGLVLALIWFTSAGAPVLQRQLQPVRTHLVLWCGLLATAVAVIAASSRDRR